VAQKTKALIDENQLQRWRLVSELREQLSKSFKETRLHPTWEDPQRLLAISEYLSLFLLGVFNPVIKSMRSLCQASHLQRVQTEACRRPVSLGSFSEAQALVEPGLLKKVYDGLAREVAARRGQKSLSGNVYVEMMDVVDSTLWHALPRMHWALWRRQGSLQQGFRLHVKFHVTDNLPSDFSITNGRRCERKEWESMARPGEFYVGDRYYGEDYELLNRLMLKGCSFGVRLRGDAQWVVEKELIVDEAAKQAGVIWQGEVRLGIKGAGPRVRVVKILGEDEQLLIATNLSEQELSAELVSLCYRQRWQVELFFRWLKHIMGANHWMAESQNGVAIQIYLTLIAAQLLLLFSGQRPNRRSLELIQLMVMGWATPEEVVQLIRKQVTKDKKQTR
jgi:hypothetical protein